MHPSRFLVAALAAALLAGCASGPLPVEGAARDLTPSAAAASPASAEGRTVLWGGIIVAAKNLEQQTRLEILGYPIDARSQRPLTGEPPTGRFLAYEDGYLETARCAQGRRVTVRGMITGTESGHVGEADYTYPRVDLEGLELWPADAARQREEPRFHFGIGIILSN